MAGYSGTPLPQKLGIKSGARVLLLDAPSGFAGALAPLPDGVRLWRQLDGPHDVFVELCQLFLEFGRIGWLQVIGSQQLGHYFYGLPDPIAIGPFGCGTAMVPLIQVRPAEVANRYETWKRRTIP